MAFPDTQLTLIQRLVSFRKEEDWKQFFEDYWGAVLRFARRSGSLSLADAEEVASDTMQILADGALLARWTDNRAAKLRTLLCAVVRNVLANRSRAVRSREAALAEYRDELLRQEVIPPATDGDQFYAAWAEHLVHASVESLMQDYHATGRGDYFRALYSRICENLTIAEIAEALELPQSTVENYLRHGRQRLMERLENKLREHVERYSTPTNATDEFQAEWCHLGRHLGERGGIEGAIQRAYAGLMNSRSSSLSMPAG